MTGTIAAVEADRALKATHRAMWALGDYPSLSADVIPDPGAILVEACGVRHGDRGARRRGRVGQRRHPRGAGWRDRGRLHLTPEMFDAVRTKPRGGAPLDRELAALAVRHNHGTGTTVMDWEYLLFTAHKRT